MPSKCCKKLTTTLPFLSPPPLSLFLSPPPPLSAKRFIGYDSESGELEADRLRHYIYGGHVGDYMKQLQDEDEEKYKAHFSRFIKEGISADSASDHVTWSCDFYDDVILFVYRWRRCIRMLMLQYVLIQFSIRSRRGKVLCQRGIIYVH